MFGGSSRSLLEMIKAFRRGSVLAHVIAPRGNVVDLLRRQEIPAIECAGISQFDNTKYGYYRGRRWLILLREIYYLLPTALALVQAKARWKGIDVVHVNEITALSAIVFAKLIFKKPLILHVRSVQQSSQARWRTRFVRAVVARFCDEVIAIDETVKASLPEGIAAEIVHNGFSQTSSWDSEAVVNEHLRDRREGTIKVAMVGDLSPMKGVYEFIEAARICKERNIRAQFIVVGHNMRSLRGLKGFLFRKLKFAQDVRTDIENLIDRYELRDSLYLTGFTANTRAVYQNIDVICFPSHLDAVGRPVIEGAFFKVPSIVAIANPRGDTIIHGETGICIESGNPQALADAIEYFYRKPGEVRRMGEAAQELALRNFSIEKTARQILDIYKKHLNLGETLDDSLTDVPVSV
jgi:glycosyltransferase involved in cell wall biosynthesis